MMTMTHGSLNGAIPCGSTPAEQSALEVSDMDTFSSGGITPPRPTETD
jgi:hypothetical protein